MVEFDINNNKFVCEDNWNEFTRKRLIYVASIIANKTISEIERAMLILSYLFGIKIPIFGKPKGRNLEFTKLPGNAYWDMVYGPQGINWINKESNLTNYTIKGFWHKFMYYTGPADSMLNISTAEIGFCLTYWQSYHQTKDTKYLDFIFSIIYRPVNPFSFFKKYNYGYNGDTRAELNTASFTKRAKKFASLHAGLKMAIVIQFIGNVEEFKGRYKSIFPKRRTDNEEGKQNEAALDTMIWQKQMIRVAEKGIFGPLPMVEKTDKDRFFTYLDMITRESLQAQKQLKRKR